MTTERTNAPLDRAALERLLEQRGIAFETVEHAPMFTVEDGADIKAAMRGAHTKNLFVKDKKGRHFLLTARADADIDLKGLHRLLGGQGRVSFGRTEQMEDYLGVVPGSVTAFAVLNDAAGAVTFAVDAGLLEADVWCCHPMTNTATTMIARDDLLTLVREAGHDPLVVDLEATGPEA
ncbi:prolyl-tRNA synthetase associated domain-containing protein [Rhizobiaceae bacterium]|nr:prolyl-tRNA synthetase associated domain-containing protein [Rhizobiaceae bacterium]